MKTSMAGYREHISVSGLLGLCYGTGATFAFGFTPIQGALAGVLTWVAGMLPDLDSDTGKPIREVFGLLAAVAPFAMMGHLLRWGGNPEGAIFLAIVLYALIRYGASFVLAKASVHRGMFHSLPALLIAAEIAYLAYKSNVVNVKLLMAGGVALGFLSHLILDELYSVEWSGVRVRLNKSAGSALKFVGRNFLPNVLTYAMLMLLTYATLVDLGVLPGPDPETLPPTIRHALQEESVIR
jgi:membrane-bound metal-dependent hydrolase YbcI (DUF457 family)